MPANFLVSSLIKISSNSDALLINDGFSIYNFRITPLARSFGAPFAITGTYSILKPAPQAAQLS